jgi:hypothetical protein
MAIDSEHIKTEAFNGRCVQRMASSFGVEKFRFSFHDRRRVVQTGRDAKASPLNRASLVNIAQASSIDKEAFFKTEQC